MQSLPLKFSEIVVWSSTTWKYSVKYATSTENNSSLEYNTVRNVFPETLIKSTINSQINLFGNQIMSQ